ncbi:MAG: ABC transporter permease [Paracoccus sp. (in: a-proteobacteria)]|jgi:fructose transport system permease protein|uniref:ABC transporter permease n=1 Tax=unclassified Paracoccus (in: a-proteobacteria) TaxID=2688777 RepID=UPI000C4BCDF3|nr:MULTISPECIES: ABC transporter permease [unclassified Paracoccus (in: a-proteobacteria)]MAN55485.1 ABC transporter permease [Paracoccus sp. (in: a-proteobacteria)]MBA50283.1 ABC transporter permease [Paracoccus sp. (in: a-proteobacteria)]HIC65346.1 ABC transporter permease [Paracoccus sp. (in: a-proteobacteria)]|tara:strand:- start:12827 stop:13882 length:1056 start_codon:yes stop_codon:yes gene_type:complete
MSDAPDPPAERSATESVASFEQHSRGPLESLQHFLHRYPTMVPVIVLVLSLIAFGLIAPNFFSAFNLSLIMQQVAVVGTLAAAQSLVILTAGIDLSVGAVMVMISVVMGRLSLDLGIPVPISILLGLGCGLLTGGLNGLLVTRLKLPPFITTLGTWNIFLALNYYLSGRETIRSQTLDAEAPLLKLFGARFNLGGAVLTWGVVLMLIVFAVLWYALNKTAWGRRVYAVGDDPEAAALAGIQTRRVLMSVYMTAGFICALAAWSSIGRVGSVSPTSFFESNLESITAVVIGGISLFGGRGSILGPLIGALIVGVFNSGLRLAGVDVLWQLFATGWLIIVAVAVDQWIRKISS